MTTDQLSITDTVNDRFWKLSKRKQRVAIARDVLAQLDAGTIRAMKGVWVSRDTSYSDAIVQDFNNPKQQLRDALPNTCHACAIGGMFVCAVKRGDRLPLEKLRCYSRVGGIAISGSDVFTYLANFFSAAQLNAIEAAFERNGGARKHEAGKVFAPKVRGMKQRVRLVMENIVANNGWFKWKQQPVEKVVYVTPGFKG